MHHNLGLLYRREGRLTNAYEHFVKALTVKPGFADAHVNAGMTANDLGVLADAARHCNDALAGDPENVDAIIGLGEALLGMGRKSDAVMRVRDRVLRSPDNVRLLVSLGSLLRRAGQPVDAVVYLFRAVASEPDDADAHLELGNTHHALGERDKALASYRTALALNPKMGIEQLIAILEGNTVERASDAYVANLFDNYAKDFDSQLVGVLKYEVPEQIVALLEPRAGPPREQWSILDLGCGTGLVGVHVAQYAQRMVGVDLSAKMLEQARARNLYEKLEQADIAAMMSAEPADAYDVIVAADVFVYIGKLDGLVDEAFRLLRKGGCFAFSVEALEPAVAREPGARPDVPYRLFRDRPLCPQPDVPRNAGGAVELHTGCDRLFAGATEPRCARRGVHRDLHPSVAFARYALRTASTSVRKRARSCGRTWVRPCERLCMRVRSVRRDASSRSVSLPSRHAISM